MPRFRPDTLPGILLIAAVLAGLMVWRYFQMAP